MLEHSVNVSISSIFFRISFFCLVMAFVSFPCSIIGRPLFRALPIPLIQDHLEGVAFFVAFAVEVLPEVDLDHLADRAACFFEKP